MSPQLTISHDAALARVAEVNRRAARVRLTGEARNGGRRGQFATLSRVFATAIGLLTLWVK